MVIYYESTCTICKQPFKIIEGSKQYRDYKTNPNGKYMCDQCKRTIEDDSRKYLFNRE
jgi:uncharacterized protein YlaI